MRSIKDDLEYRQEFMEWENLYLRLKQLIKRKGDPVTWNPVLENLEVTWRGIQKRLIALYKQPE